MWRTRNEASAVQLTLFRFSSANTSAAGAEVKFLSTVNESGESKRI
jgi:hypothetical protein